MNKNLINTIKSYFTTWWKPIAFYLIPICVFFIGLLLKRNWIIDIALIVFYINILCTIISGIIQIINRKGLYIILQYGITLILFHFTSMLFILSPPDYYGVHKSIPEGIEISKPIDSIPTLENFSESELILTNSVQPGIYIYFTNYQPDEFGYFFIRAYEVTSNDALSIERIFKSSKVSIESKSDSIYSGEFTIYEGSWGDEYGARIELWFKPNNKNEYKITSRNYIVEGWMR